MGSRANACCNQRSPQSRTSLLARCTFRRGCHALATRDAICVLRSVVQDVWANIFQQLGASTQPSLMMLAARLQYDI